MAKKSMLEQVRVPIIAGITAVALEIINNLGHTPDINWSGMLPMFVIATAVGFVIDKIWQ